MRVTITLRRWFDDERCRTATYGAAEPGAIPVLMDCGVLDVRFELPARTELNFQHARRRTLDLLLDDIEWIPGTRVLVRMQSRAEPRDRVRSYKKLVEPGDVVDPLEVLQREIEVSGEGTVWFAACHRRAVTRAAAEVLVPGLCRFTGMTGCLLFWPEHAEIPDLGDVLDLASRAFRYNKLSEFNEPNLIAGYLQVGARVAMQDVHEDGSYFGMRIVAPMGAAEELRDHARRMLQAG